MFNFTKHWKGHHRQVAKSERLIELWNFPPVEIGEIATFSNNLIDAQWRLREMEQGQ